MSATRVSVKSLVFGFCFLAYLSIQVYLPARCVVDGTYCTVGWMMMATHLDVPTYFVLSGSGDEISLADIDPEGTRLHVERATLDVRFVVRHLCEEFPEAAAIRLRYSRPQRENVVPCN